MDPNHDGKLLIQCRRVHVETKAVFRCRLRSVVADGEQVRGSHPGVHNPHCLISWLRADVHEGRDIANVRPGLRILGSSPSVRSARVRGVRNALEGVDAVDDLALHLSGGRRDDGRRGCIGIRSRELGSDEGDQDGRGQNRVGGVGVSHRDGRRGRGLSLGRRVLVEK